MSANKWTVISGSGSEMRRFHYPELKGRNRIRLAKIRPGNGRVVLDLVFSHIPEPGQRSREQYDALSYTWGESTRDKTVICNGKTLKITRTLLDALKRFRRQDREVTLWIDQICICQERNRERAEQVQIMGKIFMGARKVLVWLGEHDEDSRGGMELAERLLSIAKKSPERTLDLSRLSSLSLPGRDNLKWKALRKILRRPWFWRTWIVQEVVLNPNVEVVLGDCDSLRWEHLEAIISLLEGPSPRYWQVDLTMTAWDLPFSRINRIRIRHQRLQSQRTKADGMGGGYNTATDNEEESNSDDHERQALDLLDLLLISRDLNATDPRDKIYGLLGLITHTSTHEMKPDYDVSPEHVFNEFAMYIIREAMRRLAELDNDLVSPANFKEVRQALIMLSCAGKSNQRRELFSWIPDWTENLISRPLVFDSRFSAGGRGRLEIDWHFNTGLRMCGKLVDTVLIAGRIHLAYTNDAESHASIDQWWAEATSIANMRAVRSPGSTTNLDAFHALRRDLDLCDHGFYTGVDRGSANDHRLKRRGSVLDELDSAENSAHNARRTLTLGPTRGRVLYMTTTGYLGLAPYGTQEGDVVYVVLGANVPFVFRPLDEANVSLIGEAYVQGIMGGEFLAMDQLSAMTNICIR